MHSSVPRTATSGFLSEGLCLVRWLALNEGPPSEDVAFHHGQAPVRNLLCKNYNPLIFQDSVKILRRHAPRVPWKDW